MELFRSTDVGALLTLVGECHELMRGGASPLAHALGGISRLVDAPLAMWISATFRPTSPPCVHHVVELGWRSESDRKSVWSYYMSFPLERDPLTASVLRKADDGVVTVTRRDVLSDAAWQDTALYNDFYRPAALGDSLISGAAPEGASPSRFLILKRGAGGKPFGDRERDLVHMFHSTCKWMLTPALELKDTLSLSPRERDTLRLLMTSASEKQVAAALGLSIHTAHHYIKSVYRKLGVTSRLDLLARGRRMDGAA